MTERTLRPSIVPIPPILAGASSLCRGENGSPVEMEIRLELSPRQARLLRALPILGKCVRQWDVPEPVTGQWRPHPTMSGVEIQLGAA